MIFKSAKAKRRLKNWFTEGAASRAMAADRAQEHAKETCWNSDEGGSVVKRINSINSNIDMLITGLWLW